MGNDIIDKEPCRKSRKIILLVFLATFGIYYTIMSLLSPLRKLAEIESEYVVDTEENGTGIEAVYYDSLYLKLLKDKSYLQSRVLMAETDSIYLTINLSDSTANIEISGVTVHRTRISKIHLSKILLTGDVKYVASMFAMPLTISKEYSTIRKEPLMIKMAPRDTSDYRPDIMPDTSATKPVNFVFLMTDGTKIYVCQDEKEKIMDNIRHFTFDLSDRIRNTGSALFRTVLFRVPEYHPFIKIWIPGADAKIIYRALPEKGQVGIFL